MKEKRCDACQVNEAAKDNYGATLVIVYDVKIYTLLKRLEFV